MTTIRVCFTTIPSLLNHTKCVLRLGQQKASKLHQFSQKSLFIAPTQTFQLQKKNLSDSKQENAHNAKTVYVGLLSSQIKTVKVIIHRYYFIENERSSGRRKLFAALFPT